MFCTACGLQLNGSEAFCPRCGTAAGREPQAREAPAPSGYQPVQSGAQYMQSGPYTSVAPPQKQPRLITVAGCGTAFCGAAARFDDGSFLTAVWFKIFGIPLIPLESYRVSTGISNSAFSGVVSSQTTQYFVHSREKLKPALICLTYLPLVIIIAFIRLIFAFAGDFGYKVSGGVQISTLIALIIVFVVLAIKFWRAK